MNIDETPEKYVENRNIVYESVFQKEDYNIGCDDEFGRIFMNCYRMDNKIYIQGGMNDPNMYWIELMNRESRVRRIEDIVKWSNEYFNPLYVVHNSQQNQY